MLFVVPIVFWLIWFINQRDLYNHALSFVGVGVSVGVSVSTVGVRVSYVTRDSRYIADPSYKPMG